MQKAIFVPPIFWLRDRRDYIVDSGPDPIALERELEKLGLITRIIDPYQRPLNPFAGMAPLLQSLDPFRALRILTTHRRADVVISVFEGAAVPLLLLRRILFFRPKIVLWDVALTEKWALRQRILDFVVPRCDGIMVLNSSQIDYIERRWHSSVRVEVIGHRVDTEFFRPGDFVEQGPILSIGDDVGRDFETLIAAMAGFSGQVVLKTRHKIPVLDNLTVINERISHRKLRSLYARSCLVVVPLHDTLNASGVSTILEAGAMGKAIVVTNTSAISDFIVPGETCLAVPPHDAEALRQAIEQLRDDPVLRRRLGENARRFVEYNCSESAFALRFSNALRQLGA